MQNFKRLGCFFTIIFLTHPYNAELLLWVSARKDLMALCFGLAGILLGLEFNRSEERQSSNNKIILGIGSWLCFVLSSLSKANLLLLAPSALLYIVLFEREHFQKPTYWLLAFITSSNGALFFLQKWQYSAINNMKFDYTLEYRIKAIITAFGKMVAGIVYFPSNIVDCENWGEWVDLNFSYFWIGLFVLFTLAFALNYFRSCKTTYFFLFMSLSLMGPIPGINFYHRNFYSTRYFTPMLILILFGVAKAVSAKYTFFQFRKNGKMILFSALYFGLVLQESTNWHSNQAIWDKSVSQTNLQPNAVTNRMLTYITINKWGLLEAEQKNDLQRDSAELRRICSLSALRYNPNGSLCFTYWTLNHLNLHKQMPIIVAPTEEERYLMLSMYHREMSQLVKNYGLDNERPSLMMESPGYQKYLTLKKTNSVNTTPEQRAFSIIEKCLNGQYEDARTAYRQMLNDGLLMPLDVIETADDFRTQAEEKKLILAKCLFKR